MTAEDLLDITGGSVIAVVGCGGKTSLIELLADRFRDKKVLVSPTTKMLPMNIRGITLRETLRQCEEYEPQPGIQQLGLWNPARGKLEALPDEILARLVSRCDITLLEADGSRGLPCKGWRANEPVVPHYCTHTVGIVTLAALGKAAVQNIVPNGNLGFQPRQQVHRLPEFLALTGLKEGETITTEALQAMVCGRRGMFQNSAGRRFLLVNQVEDNAASCAARDFLRTVKEKYPHRFEKLLYGSVHKNCWQEE